MTLAQELAEFAAGCRDKGVPPTVRADVPHRILDIVGLALAAYPGSPDGAAAAVARSAQRWGGTSGATAIGSGAALPAPSAALVNGTLAHALDYDDTHLPSVLHPSASVVPAALAVAEETGATAERLIAAVAAGIEVTNRVGLGGFLPETGINVFFDRGQHATSICGTIGAAVAAAVLYDLAAPEIAHAIGVAASMGAGIIEANRTGGSVKQAHCGWAAHAGVSAAAFAADGLTGPPTALEGRFGFYAAHTGAFDAEAVVADLGDRWELLRTVYKPYPSNHFTHPGIDCALALRAAGLDPAIIDAVELAVAAPVLRTIAEPAAEKAHPRSPYHAKFSGPYTVAAALLGGGGLGLALSDFEHLDDTRLALAARITCVADERASALFPHAFAAALTVTTVDGRRLTHRVDSSRGGPEHPLTADELATKFATNAGHTLSTAQVHALQTAVRNGASATEILRLAIAPPTDHPA